MAGFVLIERKKMRDFVIKFGNRIVDICATLFASLIGIGGFVGMFQSIGFGLLFTFIGFIVFIIVFYFIYMIISINNHLEQIHLYLENHNKK